MVQMIATFVVTIEVRHPVLPGNVSVLFRVETFLDRFGNKEVQLLVALPVHGVMMLTIDLGRREHPKFADR